jgi:hypothetical protein
MIIIMRHDIPIRRGDKISHRTPAGIEEIFIVEVSSLQSGTTKISRDIRQQSLRTDGHKAKPI